MNRQLIQTNAFIRVAKKILRKNPKLIKDVDIALQQLEKDAFQPSLRTHKLTGNLNGSLACSAGYDLRIIFSLVKHNGTEAILLESLPLSGSESESESIISSFGGRRN